MAITPDTKDWTWVLQRPCPECGFDASSFPREEVGRMLRKNVEEWSVLLAAPRVHDRPSEDRWSGLEYGCHVRDVCALYDERLVMMLEQDDPDYPNWDQDATALEAGYPQADPQEVARDLRRSAERLADRFDGLSSEQWLRTGNRSDGAKFTVESFARYFIHDPIHHVQDVKKGYDLLG